MLQVGDVDFDTAAGDDFNFVFAGVANPDEVVEQVDRATHATAPAGLGDEPRTAAPGAQEAGSAVRRSASAPWSPAEAPAARRRDRCAPR